MSAFISNENFKLILSSLIFKLITWYYIVGQCRMITINNNFCIIISFDWQKWVQLGINGNIIVNNISNIMRKFMLLWNDVIFFMILLKILQYNPWTSAMFSCGVINYIVYMYMSCIIGYRAPFLHLSLFMPRYIENNCSYVIHDIKLY